MILNLSPAGSNQFPHKVQGYCNGQSAATVARTGRTVGGGGGPEVVDGGPGGGSGNVKWVSNKITTSKYNVVSFLPKFLFEQFRRYANIFFLAIGLMQQIPNVSPTGRFVTIVPFMFILFLTALKELLEDFKRTRADDKVNNAKTLVWDKATNQFVSKAWKEVRTFKDFF